MRWLYYKSDSYFAWKVKCRGPVGSIRILGLSLIWPIAAFSQVCKRFYYTIIYEKILLFLIP